MMGERQVEQGALFYALSLEKNVPPDNMLRAVDRFVELDDLRSDVAPFYSTTGRPSFDPELLIRTLLVGHCYGIRSERRLCGEVHLNLAYRWFSPPGLAAMCPTIRPSRRTATAVSATAISCAICSRRSCAGASRKARPVAKGLPSTAGSSKRMQPSEGDPRRQGLATGSCEPCDCRVPIRPTSTFISPMRSE